MPHVRILDTLHCGKEHYKAFKCQGLFQYLLQQIDYVEHMLACFANQIFSEYYGDNWYVSVEVIVLEKYRQLYQTQICCEICNTKMHVGFHSFCRMTEKNLPPQPQTVNTSLNCLKIWFLISVKFGKISVVAQSNTDFPQHYIYCQYWHMPRISPGHAKDVVDGLDVTKKGLYSFK